MPVIGDASIIVRAITDGVKKDIEKAFKGLDKAMEKAGQDAGKSFMDGLAEEIDKRGEEIGKSLNEGIMRGLGDKDKEIADLIGRAGEDAGEQFSEGFTDSAFDSVDDLIDDLVDAFGDAGNDAGRAFGDNFTDTASDFIDDLADYTIDLFDDAGEDAGDEFGDSFYDSVSSRLGDLTGTISGDFSQLGRDAGTAFGDSFASSARDGLTQAGSDFGRAISDAINANIDIQQPSAFRDIATTALGTRASGAADTTPPDLLGGGAGTGAGIGQAIADLLLLTDTAADVADAFHDVNDAAGSPPDNAPWDEFLGSMQNLERSNKALANSMNDVLGSMTPVGDDADRTSDKLDNVADAMRRVADDSDFQMSLPFDGVADDIDDVTDALDRHSDSLRGVRDATVEYQTQIPFDYSGMFIDEQNRKIRRLINSFDDLSDADPFLGMQVNARSTGTVFDQLANRFDDNMGRIVRSANSKLDGVFDKFDQDMDRLAVSMEADFDTASATIDRSFSSTYRNFRNIESGIDDTTDAVREAADEIERINAIIDYLNTALGDTNDTLEVTNDRVLDLSGGGGGRGGGINGLFSNDFLSRARAASKAFTNLYAASTILGPAIAGLISSLSALVAGFTALVSAIAPAVGVLGAIPGLIAPLIQAGIVGAASLSGIGDALKSAWEVMDAKTPEDAAAALEKLNEKLSTMDATAGPLVVQLAEMRDEFRAIRNAGQAGLFPELTESLDKLTKSLTQPLIDLFRETGDALGVVATGITDLVTSAGFLGKLDFLGTFNASAIEAFGRILVNLVDIFSSLLVASAPLVARFTAWVEQLTSGWRESLNLGDGMTKLIEFFERAGDVAAQLGGIFGDLWGALKNIGQAAAPAGQQLLDAFGEAIVRFERWTARVKESGELEEYFDGAAKNTEALGRLFTEVAKEFGKLGDNANIAEAADALIPLVRNLGKILDTLTDSGPKLSEFAVKLSEVFLALTDSGAIDAFLATLSSILDIVLSIVNSEFGQWFLTVLGPIIAVGRALSFAGEIGKFFFLVVAGSVTKLWDMGKALVGLPQQIQLMAAGMSQFVTAASEANGISYAAQIASFGLLAAAVAALTVVVITGYQEITAYNEVLNTATKANKDYAESFSLDGMQAAAAGVDNLNNKLDPKQASLYSLGWAEVAASYRDGSLAAKTTASYVDNLTGIGLISSKVFGFSLTEAMGLTSSAMAEADQAAADFNRTQDTWNRTAEETVRATGLSRAEVTQLAEKIGVDLTSGAHNASLAIQEYYNSTITGSPAALALADATNILNSSTSTAAEKTNAYLDALNALTSVQMGAANAEIAREESLLRLNEAFAKNGNTIDKTTVAGRENAKAVIDLVAKSQKLAQTKYEEEVANGNAAGAQAAANAAYLESIAPLKNMVTNGQLAEDQVYDLVGAYDTMPPLKETQITQPGMQKSLTDLDGYQRGLNTLPTSKTTTFYADILPAARTFQEWLTRAGQQTIYVKVKAQTEDTGQGGAGGRSEGGPVFGPGGPMDDLIPMMLSNGEFVLSAKAVQNLGGIAAVTKLHNSAKMTDLSTGTNPSTFSSDITMLSAGNKAAIGGTSGGYNVNIGQIVAPTPEIAARRVISETRAAAYRMGVGV